MSDKLQVVSNSISFSGLTRESFGEIKFPNSKINLLRSSMDRNIIGSKPDNDIKKVFEYLQK
ncbi:MAG: hypothetical protein LBU14_04585 [Candidatus Peribacteria bacterium]|nr:hypothetical protein [Candidatus Peribacteria bacterium]